jgi:hypothetical protein
MLETSKVKFDGKDAVAVALALLTMGAGWMVDNQTTVMAVSVLVIVWVVNEVWKRTGAKLGKRWLTALTFGLAILLSVVFKPVLVPAFPMYSGDPQAFAEALIVWGGAILALASGIVTYATTLYNTLLAEVLAKAGDLVAELIG